jgi:hypothetical protein
MSKSLRFLVLPLLMLALAAPAWADDINIIFDPVPAGTYNGAFVLLVQGTDYSVMWGSCDPTVNSSMMFATDLLNYIASNNPTNAPTGCMAFINGTGGPITELDLTIMAGSNIGDTSTLCQSLDAYLTNVTCTGVLNMAGDMVTLTFTGGLAIPPSTQNSLSTFYLGEIGVDPNAITADVTVPTYDPSTLVLLLAGMTMLGMYGVRRYA